MTKLQRFQIFALHIIAGTMWGYAGWFTFQALDDNPSKMLLQLTCMFLGSLAMGAIVYIRFETHIAALENGK